MAVRVRHHHVRGIGRGRARVGWVWAPNLWAESPGQPSQIALLAQFDAGLFLDDQGRFAPQRVRAELARRAARVPALTRRVLWTRPGQGRPVWVRDPAFDPARHITLQQPRPR